MRGSLCLARLAAWMGPQYLASHLLLLALARVAESGAELGLARPRALVDGKRHVLLRVAVGLDGVWLAPGRRPLVLAAGWDLEGLPLVWH